MRLIVAALLSSAMLPGKESLRGSMNDADRAAYEAALTKAAIPAAGLDRFKPWYAAVVLSTLPLLRAGFQLDQGVQLAGLWLRDVMCVVDDAPELVHNVDRLDALREDAEGRSAHRLRAAIALCDETRENWILNPSEELALEALSIKLERELT